MYTDVIIKCLGPPAHIADGPALEQKYSYQQSEQVGRIWVNSWELCPDFDFLSMTSLGLLISVCSRSHLVRALAENRGPAAWFR